MRQRILQALTVAVGAEGGLVRNWARGCWGSQICWGGFVFLMLASGSVLVAQTALPHALSSGDPRLLRETLDPATGARWQLVRDSEDPSAPPRMIRVESGDAQPVSSRSRVPFGLRADPPVIRSGDRVLVSESTPLVDVVMEGVALEPARSGAQLKVRLRVNGGQVIAVAIEAGRAQLVGGAPMLGQMASAGQAARLAAEAGQGIAPSAGERR